MGILFSRLYDLVYGKTPSRILMVGLDGAGKTTILYKLKLGEVTATIPTIGFNVEQLEYKNIEMTVWDMGGQETIRSLWIHYAEEANALIFVVDATDISRFEDARFELHKVLECEALRDVPVLVLANKQDMPGARSAGTVLAELQLDRTGPRQYHCQPTIAVTHDGLIEGFEWLAQHVKR